MFKARKERLHFQGVKTQWCFPSELSGCAVKCRGSPVYHLTEHAQEAPRVQAGRAVKRTAQTTHWCTGKIFHRPRWLSLWSCSWVPEIRLVAHREHPGGLLYFFVISFIIVACMNQCVCAGPQGSSVLQHQATDQTFGGNAPAFWWTGGKAAVPLQSPALQRKHWGQPHSIIQSDKLKTMNRNPLHFQNRATVLSIASCFNVSYR